MISLPLGFLAMLLVIFFSVDTATWGMYINMHAVVIVIFGTLSILAFTTPVRGLIHLGGSLLDLFKIETRLDAFLDEFKQLSATRRLKVKSKDPLIAHAADLWEQGVTSELFVVLISQKRTELEDLYLDAVQSLRNLAKYPPALGMTGTVIGMIALFRNLGAENQQALGPALALAMTATFFGLILTNGVVMPLADRLQVKHIENKRLYKNIYQILILINHGEAESIITNEVQDRAA